MPPPPEPPPPCFNIIIFFNNDVKTVLSPLACKPGDGEDGTVGAVGEETCPI